MLKQILSCYILLIGLVGQAQSLRIVSGYERHMDSIAISNIRVHLSNQNKSSILTIRTSRWVKLTISTHANTNILNRDLLGILFKDGLDGLLNELNLSDYLSLAAYDIRLKVYMVDRISLVGRLFVTGIETKTYYYSLGIIISI